MFDSIIDNADACLICEFIDDKKTHRRSNSDPLKHSWDYKTGSPFKSKQKRERIEFEVR